MRVAYHSVISYIEGEYLHMNLGILTIHYGLIQNFF